MSALQWNDKFKWPNGLYFAPDIKVYLDYIIKKLEKTTDNKNNNLISKWNIKQHHI